jgi:hypothetical protein
MDFTFKGWDPNLTIWRAGSAGPRELPYASVDFIATSRKMFPSMSDIVGKIDDVRYEYAYCELELVSISVYAEKYHNSGAIRGRAFAAWAINEIRKRILWRWNQILVYYNASIDRRIEAPIRDLTAWKEDVANRVHEFELSLFLRTDVRWYRDLEPGEETEARADKAYILLQNKNNLRVIFSG